MVFLTGTFKQFSNSFLARSVLFFSNFSSLLLTFFLDRFTFWLKAWVTKVGSETSSEAASIAASLSRANISPAGESRPIGSEVTPSTHPEPSMGNFSSEVAAAARPNNSFEVSMTGSPSVSSEVARNDVSSTLTPRVPV